MNDQNTNRIEQSYTIKAPVDKVWQSFVDPTVIEKWGGGPAVMDDKVGTNFSLWGGDIYGTNTEVVANKLLAQDWYGDKTWEKPSKLVFNFESNGNETVVNLVQYDVPTSEVEDIANGWQDYYMGPIKELFDL